MGCKHSTFKRHESIQPYKILHISSQSDIDDCLKVETASMSIMDDHMEYHPDRERNKVRVPVPTWMNPEYVTFSERSQPQKTIYGRTPIYMKCLERANVS